MGSFSMIAFHTTSTIPSSRCLWHFTSLSHEDSRPDLPVRVMGKPNKAAGVLCGSGTGGSQRVPGLLCLPFGGKIGASRSRLLTFSLCWMAYGPSCCAAADQPMRSTLDAPVRPWMKVTTLCTSSQLLWELSSWWGYCTGSSTPPGCVVRRCFWAGFTLRGSSIWGRVDRPDPWRSMTNTS